MREICTRVRRKAGRRKVVYLVSNYDGGVSSLYRRVRMEEDKRLHKETRAVEDKEDTDAIQQ